jgi:hypothetical protein
MAAVGAGHVAGKVVALYPWVLTMLTAYLSGWQLLRLLPALPLRARAANCTLPEHRHCKASRQALHWPPSNSAAW